jgi:hypothetical protein
MSGIRGMKQRCSAQELQHDIEVPGTDRHMNFDSDPDSELGYLLEQTRHRLQLRDHSGIPIR